MLGIRSVGMRVGRAVLVVLLVTLGVSSLLSLVPGSAAQLILGQGATPDAIAALNEEFGLDRPFWVRYVDWIGGLFAGDFGTSPVTNQSIGAAILERLPVTFQLALLGLGLALLISIPLAIISALKVDSRVDRVINAISSALLSVPTFIAAPLLIYVLALQFAVFPTSGWVSFTEDPMANLQHAFLPALSIALTEIAAFHRILRTDLISTLREDYVAAARAKGLPTWYVVTRHAMRPSSFSLVTLVGVNLGRLIGGTVIVETLFALPGLGLLVVTSIASRDILMVQGVVAFMAIVYVVVNMIVDLSYNVLDPRVRKATA